ncbi:MAG: serine acetyltransferase [Steroidobacteraceae bacterium]
MSESISSAHPDWSREHKRFWEWAPGRSLLASIRCYQRNPPGNGPAAFVARKCAVFRHLVWSVICGCDIPINVRVGGGLCMPHPNGIVINTDVVIGPNCLIFQQVTLGSNGRGVPVLGGHVDVGAGAKIIGAIKIGDHAIVGANAVVTSDVAPGTTVVGIPARPLPKGGLP